MDNRFAATVPPRFRGTLAGDGRPGPIEERMGRRLLRLIDPESDEGLRLFAAGSVDLIGPDGEQLGRLRPTEAYLRLKQRLERRLAEPDADIDPSALQDGLDRLRSWSERIGRA